MMDEQNGQAAVPAEDKEVTAAVPASEETEKEKDEKAAA